MLKKNCSSCNKRIERKFKFCPWCGNLSKKICEEDYGMLGMNDEIKELDQGQPLSMFNGLFGNVFNQLTKQLSKELQKLNLDEKQMSRGIEIRVSTANPMQKFVRTAVRKPSRNQEEYVGDEEKERRKGLPVEIAESKIRRLPEGIIYEIKAPGVKTKQDVSVVRLENSIEIKAYSKDRCYLKSIPLRAEILEYFVKDNQVSVQIKS